MARSRAFWLILPCSSTAGTPSWVRRRASRRARCLVRVNRMRRPVPEARRRTTSSLAALSATAHTRWSMAVTGDVEGSTAWWSGSWRNSSTSRSTPLSRVAEKSMRWPRAGVARRMRRTAGRKPRSAMWSASSRTVTDTSSRPTRPCPMRSSRRPGQATTTSTPAARAFSWGFWDTPPKTVVTLSETASARGLMVWAIWPASSRVGARTRPMGWPGRAMSSSARRWTRGRAKARVLPDPVRPRPSTSRPARVSGRVALWMGKGAVKPRAPRSATRSGSTPREAKVGGGAVDAAGVVGAVASGVVPAVRRVGAGARREAPGPPGNPDVAGRWVLRVVGTESPVDRDRARAVGGAAGGRDGAWGCRRSGLDGAAASSGRAHRSRGTSRAAAGRRAGAQHPRSAVVPP